MSLAGKLVSFATRLSTEFKSIRTLINGNAVDLSSLSTTNKQNLVLAINEVVSAAAAAKATAQGVVSDASTDAGSYTTAASNAKIRSLIAESAANLVASSPATLDTLSELAAAIGNDPNYAASISTALGNRLRLDANQTLTSAQQVQGRANLDVYSTSDIGSPDTDFVAVFNSGLS